MALQKRRTPAPSPRGRVGRPPSGADGKKVSSYPQMTMRLTADSKQLLEAIVAMTGRPLWRVIEDALKAYVKELSAEERALLSTLQRRRAQRG